MKSTSLHTWKKCKLGDYIRIKHGYAFKSEFFTDKGTYILLTPGNFQEGGGIKLKGEKEKYYSANFPDEYLLRKGDMLVVMTDLTQDAPILGAPALIDNDYRFLHNQRLGKVEFLGDDLNEVFLYYLLNTYDVRSQIKATATGATVRHTAPDRICAVEVKLPPLLTQRRIAAVLSAYDDLIENNQRRIAILEELARNLYREWFVHFRFPGHEQARFVETELGRVPEGWSIKCIGDVIEILGGGTPSTQESTYWDHGTITWYSPTDLTAAGAMFVSGSAKRITRLGLEKSSARLFPAYSVMMTSRATIGVVAINTTEACTNQGFITCLPNDILSVYHIYYWLLENREVISSLASGATFKEINKATFRKIPIILPDSVLRRRFCDLIEPMCKTIELLIAKNANLRRTRDLLLPKLVSGELDVSELEIAGVVEP
ncbi:MAG: hypothetical protein Fur005_37110 [Roseiflexaceae bacterium]